MVSFDFQFAALALFYVTLDWLGEFVSGGDPQTKAQSVVSSRRYQTRGIQINTH